MTEGTTPAPVPVPARKAKGPRRESTRIAAATKIASETNDPKSLLEFMDSNTDGRAVRLGALEDDVERFEGLLSDAKARHAAHKQFSEEVSGMGAMALVGVRAILAARSADVKP